MPLPEAKEKRTVPGKKNPAKDTPPKAKESAVPRQAVRAAWLHSRDSARRAVQGTAPEDGQYRDAAAREERLLGNAASLGQTAAGTILRGGMREARYAARRAVQRAARPEREVYAPQDQAGPGAADSAAPPARRMQAERKRVVIKRQQERLQEHHVKNTARKQPRTAPPPPQNGSGPPAAGGQGQSRPQRGCTGCTKGAPDGESHARDCKKSR